MELPIVAHWSPLSEVRRTPIPGEWVMFDGGRRIAVIRLLELGPIARKETVFRVVTWAERSEDRSLIGYFTGLAFAADITWAEYKRAQGVAVPPLLDVVD